MIGREWSCRCSHDDADTYEHLLLTRILPDLDSVAGCRGAYVLRRDVDDAVEFVVLHLFDSLDSVRGFAGEDFETAVVPAEARALLTDFDDVARHFAVRATPAGEPLGPSS